MKPNTCVTCGEPFKRPGYLAQHEVIHTYVKHTVVLHVKSHSNDLTNLLNMNSSHKCETIHLATCGKSFSRSFGLAMHESMHTSVKSYT